ncbi:hypothetical protein, partial [Streptococcus pneumoniae]|uniref:hypothetical protein n=1 Tax=Streptococcus pneumoniae TaxID=1313 RepID=UPI001E4AD3FF
ARAVSKVIAASAALGPIPAGRVLDLHSAALGLLAALAPASRGETSPAPTWGELAIEEHRRAAAAPAPDSIGPRGSSYDGAHAPPPAPRATLH